MAFFPPGSYAGAADAADSSDLRLLRECLFDETSEGDHAPPASCASSPTLGGCGHQETPKDFPGAFISHTRVREHGNENLETAYGNDVDSLVNPGLTHRALVLSPEESEMLLLALQDSPGAHSAATDEHSVCRGGSPRETTVSSNLGTSTEAPNASVSSSARCSETEGLEVQQLEVVKHRRQPSQNQRKQEVDLLRQKVKELEAKLEQLRLRRVRVQTSPDDPASTECELINMWKQIAVFEENAANLVAQENSRLRAQCTSQREIIQRLDQSRHQSQLAFEAACIFPDGSLSSGIGTPYDEDAAVFAALGRDFDVRFLQTKAVFDAVGLAGVDSEMQYANRPRKSVRGVLYFESLRSEIIPLEMHIVERIIQNCMETTYPSIRDVFFRGKLSSTKNTVQSKTVDSIRVLGSDATLTLRSLYKWHVGEHQAVVSWERGIAFSGSVPARLREKEWGMLRRPVRTNGAVSIEQVYSHLVPDSSSIRSTLSVDVDTLRMQTARAYCELTALHRKITEEILATHFDKLTRR